MFKKFSFPFIAIVILIASQLVGCASQSQVNDLQTQVAQLTTPTQSVSQLQATIAALTTGTQTATPTITAFPSVPTMTPPAPTATLAPESIFGKLPQDSCAFAGGVQGWPDGPANVNYAGLIYLPSLRDGFSMQAKWSDWTNETKILGQTPPAGWESNNDGGWQIGACNIDGTVEVFIPNRNSVDTTVVHFWEISYIKMTADGLYICSDDTGIPGDWNGTCGGNTTVVKGVHLDAVVIPGDLNNHWTQIQNVLRNLDPNYKHPSYGENFVFWQQ